MLINLNLNNNPYWYSVLLSEGFFINKTDQYDVLITDFSDKSRKISNEKSVIIVYSNYINFLEILLRLSK